MPSTTSTVAPAAATRMETNCLCCNRKLNAVLRSSVSSLCNPCFDEAGIENAHQDGHHAETPATDCPACTATYDPHAGIRTRQVSGLQGKVVNAETDGRIKGQAKAPAADAVRGTFGAAPTLRGTPALQFAGLGYAVLKTGHTWAGHKWTQVRVDGMATNKWFWDADLVASAAPTNRRRGRAAAAAA